MRYDKSFEIRDICLLKRFEKIEQQDMMKNNFNGLWVYVIAVFLTSCVAKKKMVYFGEPKGAVIHETLQNYQPTIQKGDLLNINVSAIDAEAAIPFNLYETPVVKNFVQNIRPLYHLVNAKGEINFPIIGTLKVVGSSTDELVDSLTEKLSKYIAEPVVNIRLMNFKVTVLGEVKMPGTYPVANERISVLEAIGLAGDLTIQGNRETVTLIREENGSRVRVPIDLTDKNLFSSPYFYLAQNDVLYVEPNKAKINSSVVGKNTSIIFASISSLISIIAILTR